MLIESDTYRGFEASGLAAKLKTYIIQELRTSVSLDVVSIEVAPTKLHINPVFVAGGSIEHIFYLMRGELGHDAI